MRVCATCEGRFYPFVMHGLVQQRFCPKCCERKCFYCGERTMNPTNLHQIREKDWCEACVEYQFPDWCAKCNRIVSGEEPLEFNWKGHDAWCHECIATHDVRCFGPTR